jgi:hypothetical protein
MSIGKFYMKSVSKTDGETFGCTYGTESVWRTDAWNIVI